MNTAVRLLLVAVTALLPLAEAVAQTSLAPTAPPAAARLESAPVNASRANQTIERIRTEDAATRIDELRVGGETQQITVQPKIGGASYEVLPAESARGNAPTKASGDTHGSRVWNFFKF